MKTNSIMKLAGCGLFSLLTLQGMGQEKHFSIQGSLQQMSTVPEKIYLIYPPFLKKEVDSAEIKAQQYHFEGAVEEPVGVTLSFSPTPNPAKPLEQATLILGEGPLELVSNGNLHTLKAMGKGAAAQLEYEQLMQETHKEAQEINRLGASPEYKTDKELQQQVQRRTQQLLMSSLENMITYSRQHPTSSLTPYLTYTLFSTHLVTPAMMDTLYAGLSTQEKPTFLRDQIDSMMQAKQAAEQQVAAQKKALDDLVPVGTMAKDFSQPDSLGKVISLNSFKGKYVLIDFWASWCVPCRAENPNVVKAYRAYKNKGFTVLGVSLDAQAQRNAWLAAIEKDGLEWTQVSDLKGWQNDAAKLYGVQAIPQNFLIDPTGKIIAKNLRGEALNQKLAELFNK